MSHPVVWPRGTFFYPIGNTPPVCLTQDLPPEQSASVLLLGCGDPRSILYTLFAGAKSPDKIRTLDFTCCDAEPAVLARNVLLFSLIVDDHSIDCIWNIFYHFKLDNDSFSLLITQCEMLASMSHDLDSWLASPYSRFLRVCSRSTLSGLHDHWQRYALSRNLRKDKNDSFGAAFVRRFQSRFKQEKTVTYNLSLSRSAGPFQMEATDALSKNFEQYWRTGTIFPDAKDATSAKFINPTFVYSLTGEGCAVHYGSHPLQAFHLAATFATQPSKNVKINDLVSSAKTQFRQWCTAFKTATSPTSSEAVTIRLFAGDALALCRTLYHCHVTSLTTASLFISPWGGTELDLDGGDYGAKPVSTGPTMFNIIDTSNIADHIGLVNALLATVPILAHGSSSTLYTETLLVKGSDAATGIVQQLCAEIPTISLLFGVAPITYVSNFSSYSNIHELLTQKVSKRTQYHERIAWKTPYLGDSNAIQKPGQSVPRPSYEPSALARILFDIYYRMFRDEDISRLRDLILADSVLHYHRGSFAALLEVVKSRVETDWTRVMEHVFNMLHTDCTLLMGSNNYQDLCCQIYMRGLDRVWKEEPNHNDCSRGRFRGWKAIPSVVCLILVIPRQKLRVLENMKSEEMGSPMLQIEVRSSTFHNIFSSVQFVFGNVSINGDKDNAYAILSEDAAGWFGSSSLVASVWVSSLNLALNPQTTSISLAVHSTPATITSLTGKLGMQLTLFTADLMDPVAVHVVSERPHHPNEVSSLRASMPHSPSVASHNVTVAVSPDSVKISTLAVRWETNNNINPHDSLETSQVSPCVMRVTLGQLSKNMVYPFPIDGKRSKLRVARKSGWIEVVVPFSEPHSSGGFTCHNFPMLSQDRVPIVWNIHQLSLEQLPILDVSRATTDWVTPHVSMAFSDRERNLIIQDRKSGRKLSPVLAQVKETLHSLFLSASSRNATRIYALTAPAGETYVIMFLNHLRLDLASNTLVADTCLLPLTSQRRRLFEHLEQAATIIKTSDDEVPVWKQLFSVSVERCRNWSHSSTCHYVQNGSIPLSVELDQNPLCQCGEGMKLGAFSRVPQWKRFAPYVTRAVFSPLFAVSYTDPVIGGDLEKGLDGLTCARCGISFHTQKRLQCSRCHKTSYCGRSCQVDDWKQHKQHCAVTT